MTDEPVEPDVTEEEPEPAEAPGPRGEHEPGIIEKTGGAQNGRSYV